MAKRKSPTDAKALDASADADLAKLSYEQAVEQVEQILERIESGQTPLEQSLADAERGMVLIRHCQQVLDRAQSRLARLTRDNQGQLQVQADRDDELIDEAELDDAESDESDWADDDDTSEATSDHDMGGGQGDDGPMDAEDDSDQDMPF